MLLPFAIPCFTPTGSTRTDVARLVVLASFVLLAVVLASSRLVSVLPLLLFAYGIARADWRTHIWLCFVLLFYFLVNINSLAHEPYWLDYLETGLLATLFVAAMLYCRWSKPIVTERGSP